MIRRILSVAITAWLMTSLASAQPPGGRADSPAASQVPQAQTRQTFPADLVTAGRTSFGAQCGFCHGREATGGAGGTDLTRSELVAADVGGDRIGAVVRSGRIEAGMPAFADLSQSELDGIVAFIHTQQELAGTLEGGRQSVTTEDLLSGNARAGERYFARECSACHSVDGDLRNIASRMEGLRLLQRMLYPRPGNFGTDSLRAQATVTVTTSAGETFAGALEYEDEFSLALTDSAGRYRSFSTRDIDYEIDNPLAGHIALLDRYTDQDMHDLITYLHTLR